MVANTVRGPGRQFRARPASWAPSDEWRLYRIWGDLPRESGLWRRFLAWLLGGWQQLLYVGITGRTTMARWAEELAEKSWAPDIAVLERDRRIWRSEVDVLAVERAAIVRERPVWNVVHNGNNPGAIRCRRHLPQHVVRARVRFALVACAWAALFAGLWLASDGAWPGWDSPRNSAVGATVVLVGIVAGRRWMTRPQRRRSRRRR